MDERSVIDVERYLADNGKCVLAIFVIGNPYISCDQAPKRVQREAANVGFDTAFVSCLGDAVAPFTPKPPRAEILTTTDSGTGCAQKRRTDEAETQSASPA